MFEYEQEIVDTLLTENEDFKRLYSRHGELKDKVKDVNSGLVTLDDYALDTMKKEKLLLKDRMAAMIDEYRQRHPT